MTFSCLCFTDFAREYTSEIPEKIQVATSISRSFTFRTEKRITRSYERLAKRPTRRNRVASCIFSVVHQAAKTLFTVSSLRCTNFPLYAMSMSREAWSGGFSRVRSERLEAVRESFVRSQRYSRGGVGQKHLLVLRAKA